MTRLRRLEDHIPADCSVLFVGLNPGIRSAEVGHHFAGATNKFWRLMVDAGFLPEGSTFGNDRDLPSYRLGITNLVGRPTPGISDLRPPDFARGRRVLRRKIERIRPRMVAMVGLMVFREFFGHRGALSCGPAEETIDGIACWVVPNPSGRNAHFTYGEMLREFVRLRAYTLGIERPTMRRPARSSISGSR